MAKAATLSSIWTVRSIVRQSLIALVFVLVALLGTYPLQKVLYYPFVFLFFAAIMCSAWFGGIIAGLEAVVMSAAAIVYFFVPPIFSLRVAQEFRSDVAGFVVCAIAVTAISTARRRGEAAIRFARDELERRVQERTVELERSNEAIAERERQLRELTEAIPQQIWRASATGQVEYCNRPLTEYLGELLEGSGFTLASAIHPEDAGLFAECWEEARAAGSKFEVQARVRDGRGEFRWFLIRGNPQLKADGSIARWYGVHIDIEERHRAQEALLAAQESLAGLSRTMSLAEMAASIAHELNQPLTALVADAQACRRWLTSEPVNVGRAMTTSERIVQQCTRASAVLVRIRSLFMRSEYVRDEADLNGVIRELVRLLREDAIRRNVALHLELAEGLPGVRMDTVQMQQVILNLARNGMEAMTETRGARELEIRTARGGTGEVTVSVRDTGCGLDERVRARIFEPFVTTKADGTGMGLAICRSIVESHEGRIWAETLEVGTVFRVVLPVG